MSVSATLVSCVVLYLSSQRRSKYKQCNGLINSITRGATKRNLGQSLGEAVSYMKVLGYENIVFLCLALPQSCCVVKV